MAGQMCQVCTHVARDEINVALVERNRRFQAISIKYGIHIDALYRHFNKCIRDLIGQSEEISQMLSVERLLARLTEIDEETWDLLIQAKEQGDIRTTLMAIREARSNIELYFKLGSAALLEQRVEALEETEQHGRLQTAS